MEIIDEGEKTNESVIFSARIKYFRHATKEIYLYFISTHYAAKKLNQPNGIEKNYIHTYKAAFFCGKEREREEKTFLLR